MMSWQTNDCTLHCHSVQRWIQTEAEEPLGQPGGEEKTNLIKSKEQSVLSWVNQKADREYDCHG